MTEEALAKAMLFIGKEEGLSLIPYADAAGLRTVGYGHRCPAEQGAITRQEAEDLLEADTLKAAAALDGLLGLNDEMVVALVSLIFNIGVANFNRSTMRLHLAACNWDGAAKQFGRWVYVRSNGKPVVCNGLTLRRERECELFLRGSKRWIG